MKLFHLFLMLIFSQALSAQGKFFGGSGDGFASATITNVILPVRILDFTVSKNGQVNKAELNIIYDEAICSVQLQRSTDLHDFLVVDSIHTTNSSGSLKHFVFTDATPASGVNYYRARINRCDGSFLFSGIVSIRAVNSSTHLYYDATINAIRYTVTEIGVLNLVSSSGQIIYKKMQTAGSGILTLPAMTSGIYFMQFAAEPPIRIVVR